MKNLVTNEITFFDAKHIEPLTSEVGTNLFKNRLVRGRVRASTSVKRPLKLVEGNVL
jgi:hypothetical protein